MGAARGEDQLTREQIYEPTGLSSNLEWDKGAKKKIAYQWVNRYRNTGAPKNAQIVKTHEKM